MLKKLLIITGLLITTGYGVLSYAIIAHSMPPGPEDSVHAEACKVQKKSSTQASKPEDAICCIDYNEAMDAAERDWDNSLQALIDQEIPASEMVEDGYETLRTYNCWLEYICRAVEFSGHAPIESALGTGLTSAHLGKVSGCQKPENIKMEQEWDSFINQMKEVPIAGIVVDNVDDLYDSTKINFFPRCMTDSNNNASPDLTEVASNFTQCREDLELRFGCPPGVPDFLCQDQSNAFVKLETVLKKSHADQKASALERKLGSITNKLNAMEVHVGYLSNFLQQLDSRIACFAGKCT